MRLLIRWIHRKGAEDLEHVDASFTGETATIGRATDQVIHVHDPYVALSHSQLFDTGRGLQLKAQPDEHFRVNDRRMSTVRLTPGDVVEIASHRLTVADAPEGYDYALDVEPGAPGAEAAPFGADFKQSLAATGLSRRRWSWTLALTIAVACLGIPAAGLLDPVLAEQLRASPAPDDGQWLSGALHDAHQFIGDDCTACHAKTFARARDQECVTCHQSVTHHVDTAAHPLPALEERRCASCHHEHDEPSTLVPADDALCAGCHENLKAATPGEVELANAADFGRNHPEFKPSLLVPEGTAGATEWRLERTRLDAPELTERSNLTFPHDVHLDAEGIEGPGGEGEVVMQCSDCHTPEPGGAYMQPISMERHCADCHELTFDPQAPERTLPHGEPDMVVTLLEEYYARQFVQNRVAVPTQTQGRRARRPGERAISPQQRMLALDWARERALATAADIFERTTCKVCHEVTRSEDAERASPWQVEPVRIASVWMPKSRFDHAAHRTEPCSSCHAAERSEQAADVLMPGIDSCRACHGGAQARERLASTCIDCHDFHAPNRALMKPGAHRAETRPGGGRLRSDLERVLARGSDKQRPASQQRERGRPSRP